jgi:hypothetical protein
MITPHKSRQAYNELEKTISKNKIDKVMCYIDDKLIDNERKIYKNDLDEAMQGRLCFYYHRYLDHIINLYRREGWIVKEKYDGALFWKSYYWEFIEDDLL